MNRYSVMGTRMVLYLSLKWSGTFFAESLPCVGEQQVPCRRDVEGPAAQNPGGEEGTLDDGRSRRRGTRLLPLELVDRDGVDLRGGRTNLTGAGGHGVALVRRSPALDDGVRQAEGRLEREDHALTRGWRGDQPVRVRRDRGRAV